MMSGSRLVLYLSGLKSLLHRVSSARAFTTVKTICETGKPSACPTDGVRSRSGHQSSVLARSALDCHVDALVSAMFTNVPPTPACPRAHGDEQSTEHSGQFFDSATVECAVQPCPQPLLRDFLLMFPEAPGSSALTVITVSQKSDHDMSRWSCAVEEERDRLLHTFIEGASQICSELQREGFWADFIDPSSGLPFYGPYTNRPLFETDERLSLLGLRVDDLGCCRVLRHPLWGTNVFVGTIFTVAPLQNSRVMETLQWN